VKGDEILKFKIDIAAETLSDLRQRLKNTRWSYQIEGTNWDAGADLEYLRELVNYWQDAYDWRKHEAALNQFAHYKTEIDDFGIHFIHERGKGDFRTIRKKLDPYFKLMTHGRN
jgi:hypothetical protein